MLRLNNWIFPVYERNRPKFFKIFHLRQIIINNQFFMNQNSSKLILIKCRKQFVNLINQSSPRISKKFTNNSAFL